MEQQKTMINHRQFAWMVGVILIAGGLVSLFKALVEVSRVDAWLSLLPAAGYALLVCALFASLAQRFPGKNLFEIAYEVAGKWGGGLINTIFLFHFWFILTRDLRVFSDFMNTTLLIKTPSEIILFLVLVVIIYYAKSTVEVAVRVNDLIFPLLLLLVLLLPVLLAGQFSINRLEPVLGGGVSAIVKGGLLSSGWYGDIIVIGAFLHKVSNSNQLYAGMRHGVVLTLFGLTVLLVLCITILGVMVASRMMYPSYTMVQQIKLTDFLDRMELAMFSLWLPAFILKMTFIVSATIQCLAAFTKKTPYSLYVRMYCWLALLSTLVSFETITEAFLVGNYGAFVMVLGVHLPIYVLIYLLARRKKASRPSLEAAEPMEEQGKLGSRNTSIPWLHSVSAKTWRRTCNALLAGCAGWVTFGVLCGQDNYVLGLIAGGGYLLFLLLAVIASFLEMWRTNLAVKKRKLGDRKEDKTA